MAFVFLGLLDFQGPVQGLVRQAFGLPASWSVEVRHSASVLAIMVLVLFPYVYLLVRESSEVVPLSKRARERP